MNSRTLKLFTVIGLALITGVVLLRMNEKSKAYETEEKIFLRLKKNTGPVMRGFQYSKFHGGRKALKIKAAKFTVEKKKIGIFKLSPFKVARFRDAEIDFFGEIDQSGQKRSHPRIAPPGHESGPSTGKDISFKGVLSQEMLPPQALKGSVSAICEPVKINLYLDDAPVTRIQAEKAIVDLRRRRMILRDNIQVTSGASHLSTNRLAIYPETGMFEVENNYILKTQDGTVTGDNLTTDFFLKKVSFQ